MMCEENKMRVSKNEVSFEGTLVINKINNMYSVRFYVEGDKTGPFALGNFASVSDQIIKEFELK